MLTDEKSFPDSQLLLTYPQDDKWAEHGLEKAPEVNGGEEGKWSAGGIVGHKIIWSRGYIVPPTTPPHYHPPAMFNSFKTMGPTKSFLGFHTRRSPCAILAS